MTQPFIRKPRYPVSDPLPYIDDENNLPNGVVKLAELSESEYKAWEKYALYLSQNKFLSIVYIFKARGGSLCYYQCDFPLRFLSWFPETLEKFRLPPGQSPYRGFMTPDENVDGEMLAISRDMAIGNRQEPGYTAHNFSRHQYCGEPAPWTDAPNEPFWEMSMTWTEKYLFDGGLLELIQHLARIKKG